ncbi:IclR family transcriptional regulator [Falsochrobactrum shanghaiense]|uniref:IclR family transcriptional regulator n=1 Tax=Falsochrobactrum shanghaiense TaxID=2201899 RepID=UPI001FDFDDC9|nr:helix-turn-helix domain-containing protein [Falsochrobactrum shanghaiense]
MMVFTLLANASSNAVRALDILLVIANAHEDGLALAEIAQQLGETKPAVHRSITSLLHRGFVESAGKRGHYRLGPAIFLLARRQARLEPLIAKFGPGMTEFARRTGFTVYMMVQAGVDAVCAEMISRFTQQQLWMGIGARVPMGVAAGSLALLSMLPEADARQIIERNASRYAQHPAVQHVDEKVVAAQAADARRRGYAVNLGYYLPGEGGIGLPIKATSMYEMDIAISFTAPLELMTESWIENIVGELKSCLA